MMQGPLTKEKIVCVVKAHSLVLRWNYSSIFAGTVAISESYVENKMATSGSGPFIVEHENCIFYRNYSLRLLRFYLLDFHPRWTFRDVLQTSALCAVPFLVSGGKDIVRNLCNCMLHLSDGLVSCKAPKFGCETHCTEWHADPVPVMFSEYRLLAVTKNTGVSVTW